MEDNFSMDWDGGERLMVSGCFSSGVPNLDALDRQFTIGFILS